MVVDVPEHVSVNRTFPPDAVMFTLGVEDPEHIVAPPLLTDDAMPHVTVPELL